MARILVVDDERSLRRTFALFLRDDGHEVETAEDVDQALETLEAAWVKAQAEGGGHFDVVVSDIILPRRSGVSLMEAVAERWPDIKVILVTGEPTVETAASAVRSGAYDYISKPVSSSKIRKVVGSAARVKSLQDDNNRLQAENDQQRAELARLVEVRTAEVRDTKEALASTVERISRIASNIPGVLLQFERQSDGEFEFTFMADSAQETFGINPTDVVADARAFTDRVHPEDSEDLRESLARSAETLSLWSWEGRIILPSGDVRWFQAQSRPVRNESGTVVWDGVMLDMSERKDLQARLMLSDRMASIGTLAAGVAHEINNPLTYVLANLHILGKRAEKAIGIDQSDAARSQLCSQDTLQLLRETAEGARRVRDIARDLKTFSRSSDEVQPVDVRQVLDSSLRMAINEIRHRARLERNYLGSPLVLANASRLGQVFLNLIVNAAQAIPEGAADDNLIKLTTTTGEDGHAEVIVADSGTGIAKHLIERIFEPFVTMKPVGVGTGLGLYICRDIIHHIGGVIQVDSVVGEGTSFTVRLPPAPADAVLSPLMPVPGRKRQEDLPRARILVIDDEPNIGRSFVRSLPEHEITVVDSGREGVRALDDGATFDLIFCDVMMPDVTGRDVHEHITEHHPGMLDKIVFMTGGAFTERAAEFIARVNAPRVDKPFDVSTIRAVLRQKLDPNYQG
ncbi:Sensory box histidine kinase/response regulator [Enhygromyxa salina]|uniref:histidine kinase n=1 Tax=Enhygromyxa salina TaxID=215803 RepID=A0A0C2D3J1_9BACT|nr:response regulator [Enhygromyxa salina]KIG16300.1 Sensory box histidine kinase/response regulator [Enhygromyxa salina]